jgi:hypothetical protein
MQDQKAFELRSARWQFGLERWTVAGLEGRCEVFLESNISYGSFKRTDRSKQMSLLL